MARGVTPEPDDLAAPEAWSSLSSTSASRSGDICRVSSIGSAKARMS